MRWSNFTGFSVFLKDVEGTVGTISHVDDSTANVLSTIDMASGEELVPAVEEFIVDVDYASRRLTLDLPEGLLDLN